MNSRLPSSPKNSALPRQELFFNYFDISEFIQMDNRTYQRLSWKSIKFCDIPYYQYNSAIVRKKSGFRAIIKVPYRIIDLGKFYFLKKQKSSHLPRQVTLYETKSASRKPGVSSKLREYKVMLVPFLALQCLSVRTCSEIKRSWIQVSSFKP